MKAIERHHDRIQEELTVAQKSLVQAGQHIDKECELSFLETGLRDATSRRDSKREEAIKAGDRIKDWLEQTKDQVIGKLEDMKTDLEIHRIEKDADRKEDHACDAIVFAAHAVLEAEVALMEALKARRLAIDVAG